MASKKHNGKNDHVAIMKKSWGLTEKILNREKKIESRWYSTKRNPWGIIQSGEVVYFKNSGEPVTAQATVEKVLSFENLTPSRVQELLEKYGADIGIDSREIPVFYHLFKDKKYCILIFFCEPKRIKPFGIDKNGFGAMSSWITLPDISSIKQKVY